jgi:hypothetical protein
VTGCGFHCGSCSGCENGYDYCSGYGFGSGYCSGFGFGFGFGYPARAGHPSLRLHQKAPRLPQLHLEQRNTARTRPTAIQ